METIYEIPAHKPEFSHMDFPRTIKVFVHEPEQLNENTGLMLIIHAKGGYAHNPYFIKLREDWSNRYNAVCIGVNYFGTNEIMPKEYSFYDTDRMASFLIDKALKENPEGFQALKNRGIKNYLELLSLFPNTDLANEILVIPANNIPKEEIKEYTDYGYIQTIDCIYAVKFAIDLCASKGIKINKKRIFAYGSSLGGYLAQMCLKFAPATFSLIADNSGFPATPEMEIFPPARRVVFGTTTVSALLPHFYSKDNKDPYHFSKDMFQIRSLNSPTHVNSFKKLTKSKVVIFHGNDDKLVPIKEKSSLHSLYTNNKINSNFYRFTEKDVDGKIIKSSGHAMNADIKLLFEKYCDEYALEANADKLDSDGITDFDLKTVLEYRCGKYTYEINYSSEYPIINKKGA